MRYRWLDGRVCHETNLWLMVGECPPDRSIELPSEQLQCVADLMHPMFIKSTIQSPIEFPINGHLDARSATNSITLKQPEFPKIVTMSLS